LVGIDSFGRRSQSANFSLSWVRRESCSCLAPAAVLRGWKSALEGRRSVGQSTSTDFTERASKAGGERRQTLRGGKLACASLAQLLG
jgi:hypothetical protein